MTLVAERAEEMVKPEPFWSSIRADFDRYEVYFDRLSLQGRVRMYVISQGLWGAAAPRKARSASV